MSKTRTDVRLYAKVLEAKDLAKSGELDTYCVYKLDHREVARTRTTFASENPSYDDELTREVNGDIESLRIYVWEVTNRFSSDVPLGEAVITARELKESANHMVERWIPLVPCETEGTVSGEVQLELLLTDDGLNVEVVSGTNLVSRDVNGFSDPYVVLHVLPDLSATSTQATKIKKKTLNPKYEEKFQFAANAVNKEHALLHVSVWDWDRFTDDDFMGYHTVDLSKVKKGVKTTMSLPLLPKPKDIRDTESSGDEQRIGKDKVNASKARGFVMDLQNYTASKETLTHQTVGSIRVKYKYTVEVMLPLENYAVLRKVIAEEAYQLPVLLGKVSSDREDAAWSFIKIAQANGDAVTFLNAIISHEIRSTLDPNTIFRHNSMASKAVDAYMKLIALDYCADTIGPIIKNIITSKKSAEVDPTRLEKGDDLKKNWKVLKGFVNDLVDSIFKATERMPPQLVDVFAHLREACLQQWPRDKMVSYTAVAGFIFLRLFVAATLTPVLFGVWPEHADKKSARTLTLVAKTLQNLANQVEFGQKEAYMLEMNQLINDRMSAMRNYLETISSIHDRVKKKGKVKDGKATVRRKPAIEQVEAQLVVDEARECTNLVYHFDKSYNAMTEMAAKENMSATLLLQLRSALDELLPQLEAAKRG